MEGTESYPGQTFVAVKAVVGMDRAACTWNQDKLLPGDIIEQVRDAKDRLNNMDIPILRNKEILQRELRKMNLGHRVIVTVRRGSLARAAHRVELQARVVGEVSVMRRKSFTLADIKDKNHVVVLLDLTEEECMLLQGQTETQLNEQKESRMSNVHVKDCLLTYPWHRKMQAFLPSPNSAMVFSLLLMPFQSNDVDETSARAMAWLSAAQESGVPIIFVNIQVEPILLQGSTSTYFGSGPKENLSLVANSGTYLIQDWKGTDMQIYRAIRLWYIPAAAELAVILKPQPGEIRVGVGISCTEEGFCYVSSVELQTSADRAGLKSIFEAACAARKLLVISRMNGEKLTPWMITPEGAIRCFDIASISENLSMLRQACQPIQFYLMVWDGASRALEKEINLSPNTGTNVRSWSFASNPPRPSPEYSNQAYSSFVPEFTDDSDSEMGSIASFSRFDRGFHSALDSENENANPQPSSSFLEGAKDGDTRSEDFSFAL